MNMADFSAAMAPGAATPNAPTNVVPARTIARNKFGVTELFQDRLGIVPSVLF